MVIMVTPEKELKRARIEGAIDALLLAHWASWIGAFPNDGEEVRSLTIDDLSGEWSKARKARLHLYVDDNHGLHWRKVDGENLLDGDHYNTLTAVLVQKVQELHALDSESE